MSLPHLRGQGTSGFRRFDMENQGKIMGKMGKSWEQCRNCDKMTVKSRETMGNSVSLDRFSKQNDVAENRFT